MQLFTPRAVITRHTRLCGYKAPIPWSLVYRSLDDPSPGLAAWTSTWQAAMGESDKFSLWVQYVCLCVASECFMRSVSPSRERTNPNPRSVCF